MTQRRVQTGRGVPGAHCPPPGSGSQPTGVGLRCQAAWPGTQGQGQGCGVHGQCAGLCCVTLVTDGHRPNSQELSAAGLGRKLVGTQAAFSCHRPLKWAAQARQKGPVVFPCPLVGQDRTG